MLSFKIMKKLLVFAIFFGSLLQANAYTDKPVLVNINVGRQSDTMGFNMAFALLDFFHNLINDEKVTLWDSPYKQNKISASTLAEIEKSSGTVFTKSQDVFLHEFWSSLRRKTSFTIVGATFINQGKNGKVSYGYVDFAECWKYMAAFKLDCNVNGPAELSLTNALYSRNYNFNIVQFGNKNFAKKPQESIKIRDKAFYSNRKVEGLYHIPVTKDIHYMIDPDLNEPNEIGNVFFKNIQNYLNVNREVLFNLGADKYYDYKVFKSEVAVTRIEVNETWTKKEGYIDYTVKNVIIYINNKPLDPISLDIILGWEVLYNFKTAEDVLKEKKFKYILTKLNNTYVTEEDSPKFVKSLEKYAWTQVSRYVKFY